MTKINYLILTLFTVIFSSCHNQKSQYSDVPQMITITGKIDHYDPNIQIMVYVTRLGLTNDDIQAKADSIGNFTATFESYIPLDVAIGYRTNFRVLLHPGDSLFVHFDGQHKKRPELLESIQFGGSRAKTNQFAAKYQQMYFSNELYTD